MASRCPGPVPPLKRKVAWRAKNSNGFVEKSVKISRKVFRNGGLLKIFCSLFIFFLNVFVLCSLFRSGGLDFFFVFLQFVLFVVCFFKMYFKA